MTNLEIKRMIAAGWSDMPPTQEGFFWWWDGDEDHSPAFTDVFRNGLNIDDELICEHPGVGEDLSVVDMHGWWMELSAPVPPIDDYFVVRIIII